MDKIEELKMWLFGLRSAWKADGDIDGATKWSEKVEDEFIQFIENWVNVIKSEARQEGENSGNYLGREKGKREFAEKILDLHPPHLKQSKVRQEYFNKGWEAYRKIIEESKE